MIKYCDHGRHLALKLLPIFYRPDELVGRNVQGNRSKLPLEPRRINYLKRIVLQSFKKGPTQTDDTYWAEVRTSINDRIRHQNNPSARKNLLNITNFVQR